MPWSTAPRVTAASPGQHAGARLDRLAGLVAAQAAHRVDQVERGAHGALGIVLARDRRAPHGHDRVADELLDRAAVALDDLAREVEVARQGLAHVLRVAVLGEGREADQVGEQDRDETPLGDRGCRPSHGHRGTRAVTGAARRVQGTAAFATESRDGVVGRGAPGTRDHGAGRRTPGRTSGLASLLVPQAGQVMARSRARPGPRRAAADHQRSVAQPPATAGMMCTTEPPADGAWPTRRAGRRRRR